MAAKVGNLVVEMSANVARLQRDFDKASRQAGGVARKFKTIFKGVGLSIAAGLSVSALKNVVQESINAADAIAKNAAKANIAAATYQELAFALDKFDVSQQQTTTALEAFTKRLGEARSGTGALTTFLNKYDEALLASLTSAKSSEEALSIFIDALGRVKNDADRAALSAAAFSRSAGVSMAAALKDGGVGLDNWRQKAKDLGIIISDDLLKKAEDAKDQLSTLGQVIRTRVTVAVAELTPEISRMAKGLSEAIPDIKTFAGLLADVASVAGSAAGAIKDLNDKTGGFLTKVAANMPMLREFKMLMDISKNFGRGGEKKQYGASGSWGPPEAPSPPPSRTNTRKAVEETTEAVKESEKAVQGYFDGVASRAAEVYRATRTAKEQFVEQVAELDFMRDQGLLDPETYKRAFNQLGEEYASTVAGMKGETETLSDSISGAAADLGLSFSSAFEDAITQAKSLGEIVTALAEDITRMLVRQTVTEPLADMVSGFASGFFGTKSAAGGKAVGGPVSAGRNYLVGEAGPEMFIPQTAGSIVPNSQIGGGGAESAAQTNNIFIHAADAKSFSDMCRRNPQAIIGQIEEGLRLGNKGLRGSLQAAR